MMTTEEISSELDEIVRIAKVVDDRFNHGSIWFRPWYNGQEWSAEISGWGLKPELVARGGTIYQALYNLREEAKNLKSDEQRLAEILGVDHAQAA